MESEALQGFIKRIHELSLSRSWHVGNAVDSLLVPHLMRNRGINFDQASDLSLAVRREIHKLMSNDHLTKEEITTILLEQLEPFFKSVETK